MGEPTPDWDSWRDAFIGLGEQGARKSYYPELQQRLDELRSSHQSLRDLIDSMYDAVILHDYDGQMLEVNETMLTMYGLRREEIANYNVMDISAPSASREESTAIWERVRKGDKNVLFEWRALRPGPREEFDVEIALRPLAWEGLDLIVGVIRDITERKRMEAEKNRLTAELERHKAELERMLYVFGHDMRSPVVNIQGFGGELESILADLRHLLAAKLTECGDETCAQVKQLINEEIPAALRYIQSSTQKLSMQIDGMLRVGRMGQAVLQIQRLDSELLFHSILDAMSWQLKEAGATFNLGPLPPCMGDSQWLSQVIANLLDNAIKYRQPDRPLHLDISGQMLGNFCEFRIADNGKGIAQAEQSRIWEIFYRGSSRAEVAGEGLGLAMALNIVERLGGSIRVESIEGEGSCFFITLPKAS